MPRNTAQQLYDVGYVVYKGREGGGERERIRRKRKRTQIKGKRKQMQERSKRFTEEKGCVQLGNVTGKKR